MIYPNDTIEAITNFLFLESDPLKPCEIAIVFGNDYVETMLTVKALLDQGLIKDKIVLTGHSANKDKIPEAIRFYEYGVKLGIPENIMLIEPNATNTLENLLFSKQVIEKKYKKLKDIESIMFIAKAFVMRRIQMTAYSLYPENTDYIYCPIVDKAGRNIGRDCWWKSEVATKRVLEEIRRIAEYTLKGDLLLLQKPYV